MATKFHLQYSKFSVGERQKQHTNLDHGWGVGQFFWSKSAFVREWSSLIGLFFCFSSPNSSHRVCHNRRNQKRNPYAVRLRLWPMNWLGERGRRQESIKWGYEADMRGNKLRSVIDFVEHLIVLFICESFDWNSSNAKTNWLVKITL